MRFSTFAVTAFLAANNSDNNAEAFSMLSHQRLSYRYSSRTNQPLFGILDEVMGDDYNLMSSEVLGDDSTSNNKQIAAYEMLLGDLVFSTNDPRLDIVDNFEQVTDPSYLDWMKKKSANSKDPEERMALNDLFDMIKDIQRKQELSDLTKEREAREAAEAEKERLAAAEAEADEGRALSNADVLRKAQAIDSASQASVEDRAEKKKQSFYEQEITPEILLSYEDALKKLLPPYKGGVTPTSIVQMNYDRFDAQLVKVLNMKVSTENDQESAALLEALAEEQSKRIGQATEQLTAVLTLGEPMRMEGLIVKLAREGKIDESFLLLLEANETQARDAGANGPAELMKRLRKRAVEEKDKQASSKEIVLIRKLLRADDADEREAILVDAFTPRDALLVSGSAENASKALDGEVMEQEKPMPDVPPPDFIDACKAVLLNFGNLSYDDERGDLTSRINQMASEAEVVATRIYGQGMSLRDQQDRAWKEQTTSIFDLEQMELEAESRGESAPWTNPDADDDMIPGFDAQGKMKIGGV